MAGFDPEKMKQLKKVDLDGIVLSVSTYADGDAKIGINRYYAKTGDDGKEVIRFRKLGRLSADEAKGIVEAMPELIEFVESENAGGGKKKTKTKKTKEEKEEKEKKENGKAKSRGKAKS